MDAATASVFAQKAALLNLGYVVFALFVIVGAFTFLAALGERTLGLDLRKFVDNVEKRAAKGDCWPGIICFAVLPASLLGLVLWIGLR